MYDMPTQNQSNYYPHLKQFSLCLLFQSSIKLIRHSETEVYIYTNCNTNCILVIYIASNVLLIMKYNWNRLYYYFTYMTEAQFFKFPQ